jgi:hypothetical protein
MDDDGDLRFLRETVIVGANFSAPGAVEEASRFRFADWFGVFGSVYCGDKLELASYKFISRIHTAP